MRTIRSVSVNGAWAWIPLSGVVYTAFRLHDSEVSFLVTRVLLLAITSAALAGVFLGRRAARGSDDVRIWTLLVISFSMLTAGQAIPFANWVFGELAIAPLPFVVEGMDIVAAVSLLAAGVALTGFGSGAAITRTRRAADLISILAAVFAAAYAAISMAPEPSGIEASWGALHVAAGTTMLSVAALVIVGFKVRPWSDWERVFVGALVLYGSAFILYPFWHRAEFLSGTATLDAGIESLIAAGHALVFVCGLIRSGSPASGIESMWRVPWLKGLRSSAAPALIVSSLSVVAVPVLGLAALASPRGSADAVAYFCAAAVSSTAVVIRTSLVSIEAGELRAHVGRDPLTGLPDLRRVRARLDQMVRSAARYDENMSVVVFDLDDFKTVNTLYGREEGDRLIAEAGRAVAEAASGCLLGRLGGDEFAVLLEGADSAAAVASAQTMRAALARVTTSAGLPLAASWGIAVFPGDAEDSEDLIKKADGAQYWAKHHGKDRVVSYEATSLGVLDAVSRFTHAEESSELEMLLAVAITCDARDECARYHSRNVAALAVLVARRLGLASADIRDVEVAALLHDIGKIAVGDSLPMSARSVSVVSLANDIDAHPAIGAMILESTTFSRLAPVVRAHHERWDGRGYPDGLLADAIPLGARIIALCDMLERASSGCDGVPPLSRAAALHELDQSMGIEYDPAVAEVLIGVVGENVVLGWSEERRHP